MSAVFSLTSTFVTDWLRYRRSPALLLVALATPIAAHFMVPVTESAYSVLLVNGAAPVLTPAVLGLELGMITATILTPLAYVFLRAGPTSRRPWQITDPAPYSRPLVALGRWAADTVALWMLLAALTLAGAILMFLRAGATFLSVGQDFAAMAACLCLTAGPALALTAGVRAMLSALRLTRGWAGDVAFFFIWVTSLSLPVVLMAGSGGAIADPSPLMDPFGMIYPVVNAVDVPVTDLAIGGGPPTQAVIDFDALAGTVSLPFASSRLVWLAVAALLGLGAGLLYEPHRAAPSHRRSPEKRIAADLPATLSNPPESPRRARLPWIGVLASHLALLLRPLWLAVLLGVVAVAGVGLAYREITGPTLLLIAIFLMSAAAARWERGDLPAFLTTVSVTPLARRGAMLGAAVLLGVLAHLPSGLVAVGSGNVSLLGHMSIIVLGVPVLSLLGAWVSKGAVASRVILLILWYAYFASAGA